MSDLEIVTVKLTTLDHYENNPRNNDHAVNDMAALIKQHGFQVPILYRKKGRRFEIVDGHLRVKAATALNMETVPGIDVSGMPKAQVAAFRVSVNRAAEFAEWDFLKLKDELEGIKLKDDDELAALTGFDDDSLGMIMQAQQEEEPVVQEAPSTVTTTRNKSADPDRVSNESDQVKLTLGMTVKERDHTLHLLDEVKEDRNIESRSAALLHMLSNYKAPAKRRRARPQTSN